MLLFVFDNLIPFSLGGVLGFLCKTLLSHFLAKGRSSQDFNRNVRYSQKEKDKEILGLLGVFANEIVKCWEQAALNASLSSVSQIDKLETNMNIQFSDYSRQKELLVQRGVFSPTLWRDMDRCFLELDRINRFFRSPSEDMQYSQWFHYANSCKFLWDELLNEYAERGGSVKELTRPMPARFEKIN